MREGEGNHKEMGFCRERERRRGRCRERVREGEENHKEMGFCRERERWRGRWRERE